MLTGETREGTVIEHLEELRWMFIRSLLCILVLFPFGFYYSDKILGFLVTEFCPKGIKLRYFSPIEPLFIQIKLAVYLAIVVGFPYITNQVWKFVAPGLKLSEKRFASRFILASTALFILGGVFAIYVIFPLVMKFSLSFETAYLEAAIGIAQFLGLVGMLFLGFGLMFQFPVGVFLVVKSGFIGLEQLKNLRAVVFVVILILSALLTPPDFVSQLLMGVPTYILFELGLIAAKYAEVENIEEESEALLTEDTD